MANIAHRGRSRRGIKAATKTPEPSVDNASDDTVVSPEEFYREMVAPPDVRRILAHLAPVADGRP